MIYPARYKAQEVDRVGYGPSAMQSYIGDIGKGAAEEFCLICLEDSMADVYARDSNMEIIEPNEADQHLRDCMEKNCIPEEYVADPNRLQAIIAKKLTGMELSAEDKRAMDPNDDSCPGLNKRRCDVRKFVEKRGRKLTEKSKP